MPRLKEERKCSVDGCEEKHEAKGYCIKHYRRITRYGMLESTYDPAVRFHNSYEVITETGCWLWTGWCGSQGYGGLMVKNEAVRAHRLSWELHYGPIPKGLYVCHKCDVKSCVNPDHLFLGTHKDNIQDAIKKGRIKPKEKASKIPRLKGRFSTTQAVTAYLEGR